jgi:predicted RNase H-like nuclease (RuvC/YqgF family)
MEKLKDLLAGLENKTRLIVEEKRRLKDENDKLKKVNQEFKKVIENQEIEIKQLKEKLQVMKIARSVENLGDSVIVKERITELVREIDKCIGLLNK